MTSPRRGHFGDPVCSPKPISQAKKTNHLVKVQWSPAMLPNLPGADGCITMDMSTHALGSSIQVVSQQVQAQSQLLQEVKTITKSQEKGAISEDKSKK